jgi:transcriptional regulator with XRE-family HTH domain
MDHQSQCFMDYRLSAGLRWGMPDSGAKKKQPTHSVEEKSALGRQIASARKQAGYTQEAAATDLGVIKQTISSWEKGRNLPDALWLRRLARLYQTSVTSLVGDGSASAEAMRIALLYDALAPPQRAVFLAMWNAYVRQVQLEVGKPEVKPASTLTESVELPQHHERTAEVVSRATRYPDQPRGTAPKHAALEEAARYAVDENVTSPDKRAPRKAGGGRH